MIYEKVIMKRLAQAYRMIFQDEAVITDRGNGYFIVDGIGNAHINTWRQIAMYYRWCAMNRQNPKVFNAAIFERLETWRIEKKMNTLALALIFGYSRKLFNACLRETKDTKLAYEACKRGGVNITMLTWKKVTMSDKEWARHLGMNYYTFKRRLKLHGPNNRLTYMTREEYRLITNTEKKKNHLNINPNDVTDTEYGNAEWKQLSNSRKANVDDLQITYKQAVSILEAMIFDAKVNMIKRHKTYFGPSRSFLMNGNGTLKHLLETFAESDLNRALDELREFATEKYLYSTIVKGQIVSVDSHSPNFRN